MAKKRELSTAEGVATGAAGGAVSTAITYPMDVRVTAKQTGRLKKLQRAAEELGVRKVYYGGMGEKLIKNMLAMGLTLGTANYLKNKMTKSGSIVDGVFNRSFESLKAINVENAKRAKKGLKLIGEKPKAKKVENLDVERLGSEVKYGTLKKLGFEKVAVSSNLLVNAANNSMKRTNKLIRMAKGLSDSLPNSANFSHKIQAEGLSHRQIVRNVWGAGHRELKRSNKFKLKALDKENIPGTGFNYDTFDKRFIKLHTGKTHNLGAYIKKV